MRIKLHHTKYIARRVARDLVNCDFVEVRKTKDEITQEIQRILTEDMKKNMI